MNRFLSVLFLLLTSSALAQAQSITGPAMLPNAVNAVLPDARTNLALDKTANALLTGGGAGAAYNAVAITGLVLGNGASAPTAYAGTSGGASQFLTALSVAGVGTFAQPAFSDLSGSATCAQLPALTGNVTTGAGSCSTTIANGVVTNAMLAGSIAASKLVGTDIVTVGTLTAGATGAGFTIALGTSTITGALLGVNGGTGVANTGKTITLGGNLTTSGAFTTTFTVGGNSNVTLPTTGTLATLAGSEAFTNKTYNGNSWTAGTGTLAIAASKTLTASNTLTFTGTDSSSVAFGAGGTVLYNGGALGTPSSGTLTSATGLPVSTGISGLGTGIATFLATPSSANLAAAVTDETGSGAAVFATSPTLVTPTLGAASATSLVLSGQISSVLTGQQLGILASSNQALAYLELSSNTGYILVGTSGANGFVQSSGASGVFGVQVSGGGDGDMTAKAGTFSGALKNTGITSDATHTDSTVCQDTTTHQFYSGSGAVGICLGTSSLRFKTDVHPLQFGLAEVLALKPIDYRYKPGYGAAGVKYGFAAEQVAEVLPQLVGRDSEDRANSVDWAGIVPVLVRAIQELSERR